MSEEIIYLEKYKVAPAPSRDYYGIKIKDDEVKLLHWPIRQRPHKAPLMRISSFSHWKRDLTLQHDISFVFGDSWLDHINNLILKKKSLLTLPKTAIIKILGYLAPKEIIQLFYLSRAFYETLNREDTWELIFRKIKGSEYHKAQTRYGMAYGWKQLLKDTQDIKVASSVNKNLKMASSLEKRQENRQKLPAMPRKFLETPKKVQKTSTTGQSPKNMLEIQQKLPRIQHEPPKPVPALKKSSNRQISLPKVTLNIVNLEPNKLLSKSEGKITTNEEKRRNFKASPAPKIAHKPGIRKNDTMNIIFPSAMSSASKMSDIPLDELVKKTLNHLESTNRELASKIDWLSDEQSQGDITDLKSEQKFSKDYECTGWDKELYTSKQFHNCSTENPDINWKSGAIKASASTQSAGTAGLMAKIGFDPLNSEYIRAGLGLKPKQKNVSSYSDRNG